MNQKMRGTLMLLLASLIWGTTFVAQSVSMDYIEPFTFITVRSLIAAAALLPLIRVLDRFGYSKRDPDKRALLWTVGGVCGALLFAATNLQQTGLVYTTAAKAGFITSLYIVFVPLFGLFLGQRPGAAVWAAVPLAAAGLYLLSIQGAAQLNVGDAYMLLCALFFSGHILLLSRFSARVDCVRLSCIQFLVCGLLSVPPMLLFESPDIGAILQCWFPILYAALLSACVAYTLQIVAQQYVEPARASLLMCLEAAFAALSGWIILGETLTKGELAGCVLLFAAILLASAPARSKRSAPDAAAAVQPEGTPTGTPHEGAHGHAG